MGTALDFSRDNGEPIQPWRKQVLVFFSIRVIVNRSKEALHFRSTPKNQNTNNHLANERVHETEREREKGRKEIMESLTGGMKAQVVVLPSSYLKGGNRGV